MTGSNEHHFNKFAMFLSLNLLLEDQDSSNHFITRLGADYASCSLEFTKTSPFLTDKKKVLLFIISHFASITLVVEDPGIEIILPSSSLSICVICH